MIVQFSVNEFDSDGDLVTEGVFLHFGETRILVAENMQQYKDFIVKLDNMKDEINEVYESAS